MNSERWAHIKYVFGEASELSPAEQAEFVRRSCEGEGEIEAEVLRLLRAHASADSLLEQPAADLHQYLELQDDAPSLPVETVLADRFKILRFLNRGGMGEVYEAWDSELNESVALKTIRRTIASSADVIERFKREVKHAREISHPNICRVHELFSHDAGSGQRLWFLSMELLAGATLLDRIRSGGPLSPAHALHLTEQMVSGLSAAHAAGLVHRDFKTSNVILVGAVAGQERAVITDFGLSLKRLSPGSGLAEPGGMGTPGYMAPEQEGNGEVGPLADQFALGAVLCEMLTATLPRWPEPKGGPTPAAARLPEHRFPPRWEAVICRCLQRDPGNRFRSIEEVSAGLAPPGLLGTPLRIAAAVLLLAVLAAGITVMIRGRQGCRICNVVRLTPDTDESESPDLSSDGRSIVYSSDRADTGNLDIFLQHLPPGGRPIRLTRDPARDIDPSISADGKLVVFRSERGGGGIYAADFGGGAERLLVARGRNPQISPDGQRIVYWTGDPDPGIASGKVYVLSLRGGDPIPIASSFQDARLPIWSPDGNAIAFTGCEAGDKTLPGCSEWWITDPQGSRMVNSEALGRLRSAGISPFGAGSWYGNALVFSGTVAGAGDNLWTIGLDEKTGKAGGAAEQLLREEARDLSPALALDGTIAYTRISGALHVWRIDHASSPGSVALSKTTEDAEIDGSPFVTEGGRYLVFVRGRGRDRSIWLRDNTTATESLLQRSGVTTQSPVMDRSGDLLAYEQLDSEGTSIYTKVLGGSVRRLCLGCSRPTGWFDGDRAFFYRDGLPAAIKMADPRTGGMHQVLRKSGASLGEATWSPRHELMLFTETQGDRKRMFAVHLPRSTGQVDGAWISIPDKGTSPDHPRWSGDGRTIFYISNADGFSCIYGQAFSPEKREVVGPPFALAHFHNQRASIDNVSPRALNLSVDGDSVYFNLGEQTSTIWFGKLAESRFR